jgi:hypothetical protein
MLNNIKPSGYQRERERERRKHVFKHTELRVTFFTGFVINEESSQLLPIFFG